MLAGKPEAGFAAVNALNRYMSGEAPDNLYVTLNVEARKNLRILGGTDARRKRLRLTSWRGGRVRQREPKLLGAVNAWRRKFRGLT